MVDEVHSFDKALFSALKQLLEMFNLPVLCMTATLPKQRQKELAELGLTIFPQETSAFADLHENRVRPVIGCIRLGSTEKMRKQP